MSSEKKEAAFHEAGHALLMVHYGYTVESVEISYDASNARWDGQCRRTTDGLKLRQDFLRFDPTPLLQDAVIAFAGCLSQSKFLGHQAHHDAMFAPLQNWDGLLSWMNSADTATLADYPIQFVDAEATSFVVPAHPRSFGGRDRTGYLRVLSYVRQSMFPFSQFLELLRDEITAAMTHLDRKEIWCIVHALADRLDLHANVTHELVEGDALRAILTTR